jgi:hypothetical protein
LILTDFCSWLAQYLAVAKKFGNREGSYGALFETGILIVRKLFAKHMTSDHFKPQLKPPQNDNNGRYFSPRRPMTMMSGVLESP